MCGEMQEASSGIIVFRRFQNERRYLLLHYHYRGDYWDFSRGNIKKGEAAKEAAIRETKEETGLSVEQLRFIEGFEEKVKWHYRLRGKTIHKQVTYYLAESASEDVQISEEHVGYKWLGFEDALRILRYENSKKILLKAEGFLRNHVA
jgi:bis(5'-nucleosidyl)-tetraphosphatase